jgi:hypothetical protein
MREVYYQAVGNPVQHDRLPATRPATQFLPPSLKLPELLATVGVSLMLITVVATTALILSLLQPNGIGWLEPFDLVFAWPVTVGGIVAWLFTSRLKWIVNPIFLAALVLVCLNRRTPWHFQVAVIAFIAGVWVYSFGRHWTIVSTTSPVPRDAGDEFQRCSKRQLIVTACVAAGLIAMMLISESILPRLAVVSLPIASLAIPLPTGARRGRFKAICQSVASWLTHDPQPLPGLAQSPAGCVTNRLALLLAAVVLTSTLSVRWSGSPLSDAIHASRMHRERVGQELRAQGAGSFERFRHDAFAVSVMFLSVSLAPVAAALTVAVAATMPVLLEAAALQDRSQGTSSTDSYLADVRRSPDLTERRSIYYGRVVADGSPVLVPRDVHREHAHGLGDSGSGKTSLFLCPIIEQFVRAGDCSVIVLDLKADTLELLATLQTAAEEARRELGVRMPLKFFSNQVGRTTHSFNPMAQPFWPKFDLLTRTDILCGANGLTYGTDYGAGYFSSANAAILHHTLKTFPHVNTFTELADCIGNVVSTAKKRELNPEIRKAGVHVHEVIKRLAACEALNVTAMTGHEREVVDEAIDLTQVFREPQLLYFHLSATLSPSGAPEIARLVNYMLLAASTQTERRCPVFLVIDEFQRMVAANLEYMLQLARSMGVGVILANQSMEDLKKSTTNLIPAIEANCRLRQWFSVSASEDQERLMRSSGVTIDRLTNWSESVDAKGETSTSCSMSEQVVNRFTMNDILLTSDHPFRSFLRISRGAGYAQYGGMPVIIESNYHISEEEYRRRKAMPWPTAPGTFVPRRQTDGDSRSNSPTSKDQTQTKGLQYSEEVIGDSSESTEPAADQKPLDEFFDSLSMKFPTPRKNGGRP